MPKNLDLSGVTPDKKMSDEEVGKAYVESMIMLPAMVQAITEQMIDIADKLETLANNMSIVSLYFEKKGIEEKLFTQSDLTEDHE